MIRLNAKWAVGQIENPPQWTLCRRKMWKGMEQWEAVSFCQTKKALLTALREKVIGGARYYPGSENCAVEPEQMARIEDFPQRIDR